MSPPVYRARISASSVVLSRGVDDIVTLDLEGRVIYFVRGKRAYHRGLDGRVVEKGFGSGPKQLRLLRDPVTVRPLLEGAFALAEDVLTHLLKKDELEQDSLRWQLREWLTRRSVRCANDLERDRRSFERVYGRVPVLPPDQYRGLLVRATTGCPWNACRFCGLFQSTPYRVLPLREFEEHLGALIEYLGAGIGYRKSVFLGDASLSRLRPDAIGARMEIVRDKLEGLLPIEALRFHAFADAFTPTAWKAEQLAPLAKLGLERLHVGVESGSQTVIDLVEKPQSAEKVRQLVGNLKAAGHNIGLILIIGLGGRKYRTAHVHESARLVASLPLGRGDIVYLSPLLREGSIRQGLDSEIEMQSPEELQAEENELRSLLAPPRESAGFQVARYDLREFVY